MISVSPGDSAFRPASTRVPSDLAGSVIPDGRGAGRRARGQPPSVLTRRKPTSAPRKSHADFCIHLGVSFRDCVAIPYLRLAPWQLDPEGGSRPLGRS